MEDIQSNIPREYSGLNKLEYFRPNVVRLDLPFILTENKMLVLNMPYLKLEGVHSDAIRLLDVWDNDNYVFLKIEHLQTGKISTLSWWLDYTGTYWLWSLSSITFIENIHNNSCH
ncbi:MAG: hypothetical protein JW866_06195 [Ignavibacteriales bacterium]|nr:hypothetical protein [Ignavibacteriales bacterium]